MPFLNVSGGLTLQVPLPGTRNYHSTFLTACFQKIADHDHTGGGKGTQIGPSALASNAVTGASLRLNNNQALRARNAANSADIDMIKINASDKIVLGANVTTVTLDTALARTSGGTGLSTATTDGQLLIGRTDTGNFSLAAITGTSNQLTVTNGAGTITLSTPQNTHSGASPTFVSTTLSGLTASKPVFSDGSKLLTSTGPAISTSAPTPYGSGAMTLSAISVNQFRYFQDGPYIHFSLSFGFTIGGTPDQFIKIPEPIVGTAHNVNCTFSCAATDGGGAAIADPRWRYDGSDIIVFKPAGANWTAGANASVHIEGKYES